MTDNREKWQQGLRDALDSSSGAEPDLLWASLAPQAAQAADRLRRAHKRKLLWGSVAGTAFAAAAIAAVVLLAGPAEDSLTPSSAGRRPPLYTFVPSGLDSLYPLSRPESISVRRTAVAPVESQSESETEPLFRVDEPETNDRSPEISGDSADKTDAPGQEGISLEEYLREDERAFSKERRRSAAASRLRIGASVGSLAASSSSTQSGYGAFYSSAIAGMQISSTSEGYSTVLVQNSFSSVNTDRHYYQPVSLALTVSYDLLPKLSLRSGLNYSAVVSTLSSGSEQAQYSTSQVLHYLGLPLDLNYTFLRSGRFSAYAGLGAMMQKAVAGSSTTSFYKNSALVEKTAQNVSEKELQWSAEAFAGLSYDLGKASLQFECGASYHFDNGSFVESVYKTRPLGLNISLGLNFPLSR